MADMLFITNGIALIIAAIGAFFAYKCIVLWKHVKVAGVGIEVTKDRAFLSSNLKLILVVGGLSGVHIFLMTVEQVYSSPTHFIWGLFNFTYHMVLLLQMLVLLILAIVWYRLLSKVSRWDKRWVKAENGQPP